VENIEKLLEMMVGTKGSDLHFIAGEPPRVRRLGELENAGEEELEPEFVQEQLYKVMPAEIRAQFESTDHADFALSLEDVARFRVNVFRHIAGMGAVFRGIPSSAFTLEELNLPEVIAGLCMQTNGLMLVTGKTGSGKSTTLAAMVDHINRKRKAHIITIEDPIEFVHSRKRSLISQREVGQHTPTFANALRSALREDPDVILIGELRDLETMSLAVTAAETGIMVLGTLHTNGAISTMDRLVNTFPLNKQGQVRAMLATSLRAVISQQLVVKADRSGRLAALEILINNSAVSNILREGKTEQLENVLTGGSLQGMQSMDNALRKLLDSGQITGEEAYDKAFRKADFEQYRKQKTASF
jgi:twitching motility protein PilT